MLVLMVLFALVAFGVFAGVRRVPDCEPRPPTKQQMCKDDAYSLQAQEALRCAMFGDDWRKRK